MMQHKRFHPLFLVFLLLIILGSLLLTGCADKKTTYHYAEVYLDCENYSNANNDPGNCQVITGTTSGLRIQEGMIVTKDYVEEIMEDLGWSKVSNTQKYTDVNGASYRLEVFKFKREVKK
jgi:hypothetical protein